MNDTLETRVRRLHRLVLVLWCALQLLYLSKTLLLPMGGIFFSQDGSSAAEQRRIRRKYSPYDSESPAPAPLIRSFATTIASPSAFSPASDWSERWYPCDARSRSAAILLAK